MTQNIDRAIKTHHELMDSLFVDGKLEQRPAVEIIMSNYPNYEELKAVYDAAIHLIFSSARQEPMNKLIVAVQAVKELDHA